MIVSFADKRTANVFHGGRDRSFPMKLLQRAQGKLDRINSAASLHDLRVPPGNRLERLKGDRQDQYSIRVSRGWRICFVWKDGDAFEVELSNHYD
ncbi:MAG: type II toxin-antitoxin system RelE/ParE family toxin [Gemmatimonadetes bacterium]|nr:type II toxin-antitoxin system RelE/ParE family toxin [Gemmatimonadota bacterium]